MTIQKNDVITLPKWLIILVLPMLVSLITSYGIYSAKQAQTDQKLQQIEIDNAKKMNQAEVELIMANFEIQFQSINKTMDNIDKKIDVHISKDKR